MAASTNSTIATGQVSGIDALVTASAARDTSGSDHGFCLTERDLVGAVMLGQDVQTGEAVVLSDDQLAAHGVILGAAGAGKTTTLLTILTDAIRRGLPVVAIDLKASRTFRSELYDACQAAGRQLHYWQFDGSGTGTRSSTATRPSSRTR